MLYVKYSASFYYAKTYHCTYNKHLKFHINKLKLLGGEIFINKKNENIERIEIEYLFKLLYDKGKITKDEYLKALSQI